MFEYDREAVLIRDMEGVPLARVPKRPNPTVDTATISATGASASNSKAKAEDYDIDEFLISNDPKENARTFRRRGQQSALSEALGRDLYDFEMDSDYGEYDDITDSDEEMSPQEMREMLKLMKMMELGTGRGR